MLRVCIDIPIPTNAPQEPADTPSTIGPYSLPASCHRTLHQLLAGLDNSNSRLANGRHVGADQPKALRWLLEEIGRQIGSNGGG